MLFNIATIVVAFIAVAASVIPLQRRKVDTSVICSLVLQPNVTVDPATLNLADEFNYATGYALSTAVGDNIFQFGSTFTGNGDGSFSVVDEVSADGNTSTEVAALVAGWVGNSLPGFLASWNVESVSCA